MVRLGIDRFVENPPGVVDDARIGIITNPSGVNRNLRPTLDLLADQDGMDVHLAFAPEHGVRGDKQAGVKFDDTVDAATGIPVKSLYGDTRRPEPEAIRDLDAIIFDLQTVGCRFYTYLYTLAYTLEETAETDTTVIVLDRPNPIAPLEIEGNRVPDEHASFVSGYQLPIIHGLTVGELARYFNAEFEIGADLLVIEMDGWNHEMWYDETGLHWVQPSPNLPTLTAAIFYPGICLIEATNLSEGRGTTKPFQVVGAPWIDPFEFATALTDADLAGVRFRPTYFTPAFSKHEGERVGGVEIHVDYRSAVSPVQVGLTILLVASRNYPKMEWRINEDAIWLDRLGGGPELRRMIETGAESDDPGAAAAEIHDEWQRDADEFAEIARTYRAY